MNFSPEAEQNLFQKRNLPSYICWIILLVDLLQNTEQFLPLKLNLVEVLKSKYKYQKNFRGSGLRLMFGFVTWTLDSRFNILRIKMLFSGSFQA